MKKNSSHVCKKFLAVIIGIAIFLPIAEALTRAMKLDTRSTRDRYLSPHERFFFNVPINTKDPYLFWRIKPLTNYGKISSNSKGFRGKEFSEIRDDNTYRIITIGDSCTLGVGVSNKETYSSVLENMLNNRNQSSRSFEVINGGVVGYIFSSGCEVSKNRGHKI